MTDHNIKYIGVDVAKKNLVIFKTGDRKAKTFENNKKGHQAFIKNILPDSEDFCVVVEATGGYETAFIEALVDAHIDVALVQPYRVRAFAKSQGIKAKTDPIDAQLITKFAIASHPRKVNPHDKKTSELRSLLDHRHNLINERTRATNRLDTCSKIIAKHIKKQLLFIEKQITLLDLEIDKLCQENEQLLQKQNKLQKVQGLGPVASRTLIAYLPELGQLNDKEIASLAGVAPYNQDSGNTNKPMRTQGGRTKIKAVLYMAAIVAIRHNPILKQFYERLKNKGKASKIALVAVMRKLITLANKIIKYDDFLLAS